MTNSDDKKKIWAKILVELLQLCYCYKLIKTDTYLVSFHTF